MARRNRRTTGRIPDLTKDPEQRQRFMDAIALGNPVVHSAEHAGYGYSTCLSWFAKGRDAQHRREQGAPPQPNDDVYVAFLEDAMRARARFVVSGVANIQKAARGGFVRSETTRTYVDENGRTVTERTKVYADPEWKAALSLLERGAREWFGKTQRIELAPGTDALSVLGVPSGEEGPSVGPGDGESAAMDSDVVDRVAQGLAAAAERYRLESSVSGREEPVDAEIVDDDGSPG